MANLSASTDHGKQYQLATILLTTNTIDQTFCAASTPYHGKHTTPAYLSLTTPTATSTTRRVKSAKRRHAKQRAPPFACLGSSAGVLWDTLALLQATTHQEAAAQGYNCMLLLSRHRLVGDDAKAQQRSSGEHVHM
jgi:hypothetical protein